MEYTLSQVLWVVKTTFDEFFWEFQFWCAAEVMACKTVGKNTYLQLVEYEENESGKTTTVLAKINGNIFKPWLIEKFFTETWLDRTSIIGQKILFQWRVSYHKDYGVSVLVNLLSSSYTLWLAQKNQHAILQTLKDEWIVDKNRYLTLAEKPLSLAIISWETSAWLEDFLHILQDAGIVYTYTLFQAVVQWNSAKESVQQQLINISQNLQWDRTSFDLVCVIRGGWESGWIVWQNDIDIARSVCMMSIPVMIAIWHTQDTSVLESVAWKFAKTPSEAAFYILQHYNTLLTDIVETYEWLVYRAQNIITLYRQKIQDYYTQITYIIPRIFTQYYDRIENLYTNILAYHPQWVLERWYTIIRDAENQKILTNTTTMKKWDDVVIETSHSYITATVQNISNKDVFEGK